MSPTEKPRGNLALGRLALTGADMYLQRARGRHPSAPALPAVVSDPAEELASAVQTVLDGMAPTVRLRAEQMLRERLPPQPRKEAPGK